MFLDYCNCSNIIPTVSLVFAMLCANRTFRMPSSQRSQACFLLCLRNTPAFHLNQAPTTLLLCSPFPIETLDVKLQVCRILRHFTLFFNPNLVPPSVSIDNIWIRLLFVSCILWVSDMTVKHPFLSAPLALKRVRYVPSPEEEQSSVAAEHSGLCLLRVRVSSFSSKGHQPHRQGSPHDKAHFTESLGAGKNGRMLNNLLIWYFKRKSFGMHYVQPWC